MAEELEVSEPTADVVNLNFWREGKVREDERRCAGGGDPPAGGGGPPPPAGSPPPPAGAPTPTFASDDQLALKLVARLGDDWHYVARSDDWYYWDGRRWVCDECRSLISHIREVCREVSAFVSTDSRPLARTVSNGRTIFNVEKLARSDARIALPSDGFDADKHLLNTPGGIVDLVTGQLYPHDRRRLMTQLAGAAPEGDCPVWKRFLGEFTGGDQDYQGYLQRLVGYSLTGETMEEIFAFCHGMANTGKSKFVETIRALHGSYGTSACMDTFIATPNHAHATEIARFVGKRLVTAAETDENCRWDQQRMTTLTGRDEITANFMRQDQFSYYPQFLLLFHGNHRPRLNSDGGAMQRRLHLLPTRHKPKRIDKQLIDKLKAELGGIMLWAVEGAVLWYQHGLRPPPIVAAATEAYFVSENTLQIWIDERCDRDKSKTSLTRDLYSDYSSWAKASNEYVLSEKRFADALDNLGFERWKHSQSRRHGFIGLILKNRDDELGL